MSSKSKRKPPVPRTREPRHNWGFQKFASTSILIWFPASAAALLAFHGGLWFDELGSGALYLWFGAGALLLAEALLVAILLGAAKGLAHSMPHSRAGKALLACGSALLAILLFLSLVSWSTCIYQNGFLTRSSLLATVLDFPSIFPFLSLRERVALGAALLASTAIILWLAAKAPAAGTGALLPPGLVFACSALISVLCLRVLPAATLGEVTYQRLEGIVKARLGPTATILWGPMLYPRAAPYAVTTPLKRRYELEDYAARIDRARPHPNLLLIAIESLRQDEIHRTHQGRLVMPTLSRLASEGLEFRRAYATGNESLYSMTSLVTGLHPLKTPARDRFTTIDYPMLRLCDLLSPVYDTAFISSSNEQWQNMVNVSRSPHLGYFFDAEAYRGETLPADTLDTGFASEVAKGHLRTGTLDDATTTAHLQEWLRRKRDKPFFAMVSYQTSHFPYEQGFHVPAVFTPNQFTSQERSGFSFVSYPPWALERMRNRYWNSLAYIDSHIASTIGLLRESGALENTVVAILGDHGELFLENGRVTHAGELHEMTIRSGLVLFGKNVPRGKMDQPISLLDLLPLFLELCGMPRHDGFQGTAPRLDPGRPVSARPIFSTVQNLAFEDSVIAGEWKYVEQAQGAYSALFDLISDPNEQHNARRKFPRHTECLQSTLHEFRNNQFAYYQTAALKASYFPPRIGGLSRTWACEIAFGNVNGSGAQFRRD